MKDVNVGFAQGPFFDSLLVTEAVERHQWIPMPRFLVPQGEKVRPVDDASATGLSANLFARMTEALRAFCGLIGRSCEIFGDALPRTDWWVDCGRLNHCGGNDYRCGSFFGLFFEI